MKRYISLALAAVVLVVSLAVPSYAAETVWLDILDYATADDIGRNFISVSDNVPVNFNIPYANYKYIDILVQFAHSFDSSPVCDVYRNSDHINTLSCVKVSDSVYRYFGNIDGWYTQGISFAFSNLPFVTGVQFLSARTSVLSVSSYNLPVSGYFSYANGEEESFFYTDEDHNDPAILYGSSDFDYQNYTCYLQFNDAIKYDYIDIQLYFSHLSLVSLSASFNGLSIPYEVSYFDAGNTFEASLINVTLDLTGIDRNLNLPLEIILTGSTPTIDGQIGYFSVLSSNGLVEVNYGSPLLNFWYRIKTFFTDRFASLNAWIDNQTSSITGTIAQWGQKIVEAINPDTGAAEDALKEGSQAADQVTDLTGQMNSIVKPDLSGGGDISSIISPGDMSSYTVFLSTVVNAPYIGQVVMLSLILSLAGYVLFGKR